MQNGTVEPYLTSTIKVAAKAAAFNYCGTTHGHARTTGRGPTVRSTEPEAEAGCDRGS
jgi:hypothetical protein